MSGWRDPYEPQAKRDDFMIRAAWWHGMLPFISLPIAVALLWPLISHFAWNEPAALSEALTKQIAWVFIGFLLAACAISVLFMLWFLVMSLRWLVGLIMPK